MFPLQTHCQVDYVPVKTRECDMSLVPALPGWGDRVIECGTGAELLFRVGAGIEGGGNAEP